MKRNEFSVLYDLYIHKNATQREIAKRTKLSLGNVSTTIGDLAKLGYLNQNLITQKGKAALKPYKVDNAVIMAAGMSTRFVPISLETPKGLLEVKGEVLIERQINQLVDAGIKDIVLVLGYKKESFFYLKDKYPFIKFIINKNYNIKNNIETLYLAQKHLKNTYICSSDDYFVANPFQSYVYESYYSAVHVNQKTSEWYMISGNHNYIKSIKKHGTVGDVMLGHVYWNKQFSNAFVPLINKHHNLGDYDQFLWEQLLADNIKKLPPMYINVYPNDMIFEFDSLTELRAFDNKYIRHTNSKIIKNICKVLKCQENDVHDFVVINSGLTNTSFHFEVKGKRYVYRHPGEGTEKIISRKHEKTSLELAKKNGSDPTYIYMEENEGWKISRFVNNIRIPKYSSFGDSKRVIKVLKNLHSHNYHVNWGFRPWEDALAIEKLLRNKGPIAMKDFNRIKEDVSKVYKKTLSDGVTRRFCHCDTYAPNWMFTKDKTILIDWEYAGEADPGCDLGCYIMDSMWGIENATKFIKEYCGKGFNQKLLYHYLAYVAVVSYYWFVWALYRESCGADTGEYLLNWLTMAKRYSSHLLNKELF